MPLLCIVGLACGPVMLLLLALALCRAASDGDQMAARHACELRERRDERYAAARLRPHGQLELVCPNDRGSRHV